MPYPAAWILAALAGAPLPEFRLPRTAAPSYRLRWPVPPSQWRGPWEWRRPEPPDPSYYSGSGQPNPPPPLYGEYEEMGQFDTDRPFDLKLRSGTYPDYMFRPDYPEEGDVPTEWHMPPFEMEPDPNQPPVPVEPESRPSDLLLRYPAIRRWFLPFAPRVQGV